MAKAKFALGALIGVAAGFIAGVLTAPKSGKATRDEIKQKANEKKKEAMVKGEKVRSKAGDIAEDVVEKAEKAAAKAADTLVDVTAKAAHKVTETTKDLKSKSHGAAKSAKDAIEKNK